MNRQKQIKMAKEIIKYIYNHMGQNKSINVSYNVLLVNVIKIINKYTYASKR